MTMQIAPHAADAVQIPVALNVVEPDPLGRLDDERLIFGHLGKGVPVVIAVPLGQYIGIGHGNIVVWFTRKLQQVFRHRLPA